MYKPPRFARQLVWGVSDSIRLTTPLVSLYHPPVPTPPANEVTNEVALNTISNLRSFFRTITPIHVDVFEFFLISHPNRPFVDSVCRALREGFWPWADTSDPALPSSWDNSSRVIKDPAHVNFVRDQIATKVALGQLSPSFGPDLLPGMFSMPLWVVPKPHSNKLRMVVDQSAEPFSQNSLIPADAGSIHLDNLHDLGTILRRVHSQHPFSRLTLWKSDVSRAYRLAPVHPLWQIRQIVSFGGNRHVDRCNNFGNRAGGHIWFCIFLPCPLDSLLRLDHS